MMESTTASVPLMISSGNHESDYYLHGSTISGASTPFNGTKTSGFSDYWSTSSTPSISSGGECGVSFKIWPSGTATPAKPWYSYAMGLVTVVVYSTEHNITMGSEQWNWLRDTLASVDRTATPWIITTGHRAAYVDTGKPFDVSSWAGDVNVMRYTWSYVDPLMATYNVSLHYSGHTHVTQRHCAAYQGVCKANTTTASDGVAVYSDPGYPVYYSLGNAGAVQDSGSNVWGKNFTLWSSSSFAYASVTVKGRTMLEVNVFDPSTGNVLDTARIVNSKNALPPAPSSGAASSGMVGLALAAVVAVATAVIFGRE